MSNNDNGENAFPNRNNRNRMNNPYINIFQTGGGFPPRRTELYLYQCFGKTEIDDVEFRKRSGKPVCSGIETKMRASTAMTAQLVPFLPHDDRTLRRYKKVSQMALVADCRNEMIDPMEKVNMLGPFYRDDDLMKPLAKKNFSYTSYGKTRYATIEKVESSTPRGEVMLFEGGAGDGTDLSDRNLDDVKDDEVVKNPDDAILIGAPNCTTGFIIKQHEEGKSYLFGLGGIGSMGFGVPYDPDDDEEEENLPQNQVGNIKEIEEDEETSKHTQQELQPQDNVGRKLPNESQSEYQRRRWERRARQRMKEAKEVGANKSKPNGGNSDENEEDSNSVAGNVLNPWSALTSEEKDKIVQTSKRVAGKTWENFWTLTTAVKDSMKDDFPSRVWDSSNRIVNRVGKNIEQCKVTADKLYDFLTRDDDDDDDGGDEFF